MLFRSWWVMAVLAVCYFGNMVAIVAFVVAGTSDLPDHEQGLATGLSTMAQQIGITVGIPLLSAVTTAFGDLQAGVVVGAATTLGAAVLIRLLGRPPGQATSGSN